MTKWIEIPEEVQSSIAYLQAELDLESNKHWSDIKVTAHDLRTVLDWIKELKSIKVSP